MALEKLPWHPPLLAPGRQPLTDATTGLRVLELLEAASQSAECGGRRISLKTGKTVDQGLTVGDFNALADTRHREDAP